MSRTAAVARAFAGAADYDRHADVQRQVADRLAVRIEALALPSRPRILDVGCGTGFLPARLMPGLPGADWVISDLAGAMVLRARDALPAGAARFVAMDATRPCFAAQQFDLVCSNLAAQWFDDLPGSLAALAALVAPGGILALSTLLGGSFAEWRSAHSVLGLESATPDYPDAATLARLMPGRMIGGIETEAILHRYEDSTDLLHMLRGIGATVPRAGRRPLSAGTMRAVMRQFEAMGAAISYEVAYCLYRQREEG
jgi:malonyl-CoA O-methyltransferase